MPRTKKKPDSQPGNVNGVPGEVLTLAEAAGYLRLSEAAVLSAIQSQGLPGRLIGGEWRFLKPAIQQGFRITADGRQGSAQLMRNVGHKLLACLLLALQFGDIVQGDHRTAPPFLAQR